MGVQEWEPGTEIFKLDLPPEERNRIFHTTQPTKGSQDAFKAWALESVTNAR